MRLLKRAGVLEPACALSIDTYEINPRSSMHFCTCVGRSHTRVMRVNDIVDGEIVVHSLGQGPELLGRDPNILMIVQGL